MQVTLKKIKIAKYLSEETLAYTADLYIDGVMTAHVSNRGTGGCDDFLPMDDAAEKRIAAAEKHFSGIPCTFAGRELDGSLELEIARILEEHETKTWLRSQVGRKVIFIRGGETYSIKATAAQRPSVIQRLRQRHPDCKILNEMPIDEAVTYCRAG